MLVKLPGIADVPGATAGGGPLEIEVVGQQFAWEYRYPNGVVAIDHLRAPAGRPVRLKVTAPDWDVVHSWWIPALGGKIDAIPGRTKSTWFEADRTGTYKGQCAELCGLYHAKMLAQVEVLDEAAFDSWLAAEQQEQQGPEHGARPGGVGGLLRQVPRARRRRRLRPAACSERRSPTPRRSSASRARDGRSPAGNVMPPVGRDWTQEQMDSLNAYLEERFGNQS